MKGSEFLAAHKVTAHAVWLGDHEPCRPEYSAPVGLRRTWALHLRADTEPGQRVLTLVHETGIEPQVSWDDVLPGIAAEVRPIFHDFDEAYEQYDRGFGIDGSIKFLDWIARMDLFIKVEIWLRMNEAMRNDFLSIT